MTGRFGDNDRLDRIGLAVLQLAGWSIVGGMVLMLYHLFT